MAAFVWVAARVEHGAATRGPVEHEAARGPVEHGALRLLLGFRRWDPHVGGTTCV